VQPKNIVHRFRRPAAPDRAGATVVGPPPETGRPESGGARPAAEPSPEALPNQGFLARLAGDVAEMLRVDRVTVAIPDPEHADTGIVAACLGAPGMLGMRLPLPTTSATGVKSAAEVAALGLGEDEDRELPWSFAHVPIAGFAEESLGAVTVVSRRARAFSEQDLLFIEKLARRRVPEFDRRRGRRTPQTTV
jgi:hypothetical protein